MTYEKCQLMKWKIFLLLGSRRGERLASANLMQSLDNLIDQPVWS